jgi:uncharacterized protein (TIGR02444 family)
LLRGDAMVEQRAAAEAFWRFSLMIYSRAGVAETLIRLQDERGHNVNLVLFGLWLALCEATPLDGAGLARASAAIEGIDRDVVQPLRRLRRALKADAGADAQDLRRRVLGLEITAERRVQARLARTVTSQARSVLADRKALAEANLRLILGADFTPEVAKLLATARALKA